MPPSGTDPRSYLIEAVEVRVAQMGRRLGEGAEHELRRLVDTGLGRLHAEEGDISDKALEGAKGALIELVESAERIALTLDDYAPDLLGERSFFPALGRFCPRYPFC